MTSTGEVRGEEQVKGEKGEKRGDADAVAVDHSHRLIMETRIGESAENVQHLEVEVEAEAEEGEKFESGYNTISNRDTPEFLRELNLVLILSFLSLSSEERLDSQVIKPKDLIKHPNPKGTDSSLHVPKVNDFRPLERKTHKFQTKIRDCRHARRM